MATRRKVREFYTEVKRVRRAARGQADDVLLCGAWGHVKGLLDRAGQQDAVPVRLSPPWPPPQG